VVVTPEFLESNFRAQPKLPIDALKSRLSCARRHEPVTKIWCALARKGSSDFARVSGASFV